MFCKSCCISLHVCPICRANVDHFYPSPKSMANYLNDLKIKCTLCEMNLLKEGFGKHLYECSNVKILCICGELVARINEPNHILNCSANVDCGGKSLGCQIVLRRNEIKDHEKTCIYVECQQLKKENQQLRQQIESLTIQTRGIPGVKKESDNRKYKRGDKGKPGKKIDSDEEDSDSSGKKKRGSKVKPVNKIDSDEEDTDSSVGIEKNKIDIEERHDIKEKIRLNGSALMSTDDVHWKLIDYIFGTTFLIIKKKKESPKAYH